MILLVDIGNTRTKWRLLSTARRCVESGDVINGEVSSRYISEHFFRAGIAHIYIANVAAESMLEKFEVLARNIGAELRRLQSQPVMLDVKLKYQDISRLGVDRGLALVGAFKGKGVLVIDAGSAITADYLSDEGEHLGGYIIPGLEMSRNLLISKTAKVGVLADIGSDQPGLSTGACVNNGVVIMLRSLVAGLIDMAEAKGINCFVVTGGDGGLFKKWGDDRLMLSENLVLDGMARYCIEECRFLGGNK